MTGSDAPSDSAPRAGLLAGGNWLIDHVKRLDVWPPQDALAHILAETWANGGAPYNVLKDLARLGAPFPLAGIGLIGDDADGARILADCRAHGIDTTQLRSTPEAPTSYCDVMTEATTGRRTFFYQSGANARLAPEHFDFTATRAKHFHLGYLLLLDGLDALDADTGLPRAAAVLHRARAAGLRTSVDCVSEPSDRFGRVVRPVLPEVDLLFANDFEAEKLTGVSLRPGGPAAPPDMGAVERAAAALLAAGVREWVVLHFPEGVHARHRDGSAHGQSAVALPANRIRGTAGAGDALAAGVLYGLHEDWPMPRALGLGVAAAAASLTDETCSAGVRTAEECLRLAITGGEDAAPAVRERDSLR